MNRFSGIHRTITKYLTLVIRVPKGEGTCVQRKKGEKFLKLGKRPTDSEAE